MDFFFQDMLSNSHLQKRLRNISVMKTSTDQGRDSNITCHSKEPGLLGQKSKARSGDRAFTG